MDSVSSSFCSAALLGGDDAFFLEDLRFELVLPPFDGFGDVGVPSIWIPESLDFLVLDDRVGDSVGILLGSTENVAVGLGVGFCEVDGNSLPK